MKTINKEMYQALEMAIIDEYDCFDHMAMFQAMEYILGIIDIDDLEYDNTLRAVNRVLEECGPSDDKVLEILKDFNDALEDKDYLEMAACITAMKETDPIYVSIMLDAMYDDEDEE
jgi:50S ribosomal subunit-associated GTPase HflX